MPEVLIAAAMTGVLAAGMFTGVASLHRGLGASRHHAKAQVEQGRLLSYVTRDLRRAVAVEIDESEGSPRLTLKLPDFYDDANNPRDPRIRNDQIEYTDSSLQAPDLVTVRFYLREATMFRSVTRISRETGAPVPKETVTAIATDLTDFLPTFTDAAKRAVAISVSFMPKFQLAPEHTSSLRAGTTVHTTTLLRNKRS